MAYAAVKTLMHTIRGLLDSSRISGAAGTQESLQSALNHAASLLDALKRCSGSLSEADQFIIIEESRKLEDAIEIPISAHDFFSLSGCTEPPFDHLSQDVDRFAETAKKMQENIKGLPKTAKINPPPKEEDEEDDDDVSSMIGLSDQFLQLRDLLTAERPKQPVFIDGITIWFSGMAGIGKTRLAKKLFHDPSVVANFEYRGFVRAGRDFVAFHNDEKIMEGDDDSDESFWRLITDTKCLVVLDNVQENYHFFDHVCSVIEDNSSRLLVTSRIDASTEYFSVLKMRFLNEHESWELLRKKVFVEEEEDYFPPPELVKAGKKIAEKCEGLPLLIIAVAPILLAKAQKNPERWKRVAEKPSSLIEDASHQISEVLLSNYHHLLEDEKSCFLYIAAFPLTYVVSRTTIGYLWYAEGLVHDWRFAAKFRLDMLVRNNLVMGNKGCRFTEDFHKVCSLHCAYWYVSRRVAENNKFLYTVNSYTDGLNERVRSHRRLAIYNNVLFAIKDVHSSVSSISSVRSLLCTGPYHPYQVPLCWEWKLLRVLSALTIRFYEFPVEVVKQICLKFLSLTCNANLPPSISKLWNLQFLIIHQHSRIKRVGVETYLPVEIWDFQKLEHLEVMGRNLPDPPRAGVVLPRLEKLLDVGVKSCTRGVLQSLPRIKKLRIQIVLAPDAAETTRCFDDLSCLDGVVRSFQSVVVNPALLHLPPPPPLSISIVGLTKLSLSGFGYHWEEDMKKIAELPKLEVLKLKCYAFVGEKWEVGEGFLRLRRLSIEDADLVRWTAGEGTFPILSRVAMKNCHKLREIPLFSSMYCVDMELVDCHPLAESCTKQRYTVHDKLCNVFATYSWNEEKKLRPSD